MVPAISDDCLSAIKIGGTPSTFVDLATVASIFDKDIDRYPFVIRVLLENVARSHLLSTTGKEASAGDLEALIDWQDHVGDMLSLFLPRVILPDSSGIPALMDLAALRDVTADAGGHAASVEPRIPVDLIVDHSLQVDRSGTKDAFSHNLARELERNQERYRFLKWAGEAFKSVRVHPPGSGIIHQINLECLAEVVRAEPRHGGQLLYPDFVIGGDSHTPMVGGIGVLGWGVGGIDAEAAMLGSPYLFPVPEVVGVRLTGSLRAGTTATDLVLSITEHLRGIGVAGKMVEFSGPGVDSLTVPERATLSNMAPEYGATCGFFPVDHRTIAYLEATRTDPALASRVEAYCRSNRLFRDEATPTPDYSTCLDFDMGKVGPSVAGPRRPQDRIDLGNVSSDFRGRLSCHLEKGGFRNMPLRETPRMAPASRSILRDGAIVIAAITSCTNTSNPSVMIAAGLLARKARERGIFPPDHVKRSLAPGSRVVTSYLAAAGLVDDLEALGFHLVGYGCTTCGGKSGPLADDVAAAIESKDLVVAAVLSGNRNFEGRIHRQVRANYIMSPPLVVAYSLAGRVDIDLTSEPLALGEDGKPVYLSDLWPSEEEIGALEPLAYDRSAFSRTYGEPHAGHGRWAGIPAAGSERYAWDEASTYLQRPPFFDLDRQPLPDTLSGVRLLGLFGDSLTTDHISPSGEIPPDSPAGRYLIECGVVQKDFNTYVGRRGNDQVMTRATFANIRLKNRMVPGREGWHTLDPVTGEQVDMYDAAMRARAEGLPLAVIGGAEYGTGSSRDWAAKGSMLLGIRIVLAESFERIHRANLVGVGILPLLFPEGVGWRSLGLDGTETYTFTGIRTSLDTGSPVRVGIDRPGQEKPILFDAAPATLNGAERDMLKRGGMFSSLLKDMMAMPEPAETRR